MTRDPSAPVVVVSADSHIGPRVEADLREYCPRAYREQFDDFAKEVRARRATDLQRVEGGLTPKMLGQYRRSLQTSGHHDMAVRLRDMDADGVAAEVIFHASGNGEGIPFASGAFGGIIPGVNDPELVAVGYEIYNRWLADATSIAPERLVGLAYLPLWDIEAAVKELERARASGLKGVNFPAPRPGLPEYDDPVWEPFWSAVAALDMPLATHGGSGHMGGLTAGPHARNILQVESGGWLSRKAMHRMIFGGVFEQHPQLKLVLTEQSGEWWPYHVREFDSSWLGHHQTPALCKQVPRKPSEYMAQNIFVGASMLAPFEARAAVRDGYAANVLWGRDYPHPEGCWQYQDDDSEPTTRLSLRYAFHDVAPEPTRLMVGENGAKVYGLDMDVLTAVAATIGAPTLDELARPIDAIPELVGQAFRQHGPWS